MDDAHPTDLAGHDPVVAGWRRPAADPMVGVGRPEEAPAPAVPLPDYLQNTYAWAYLNPVSRAIFDHPWVVSAILWGNANRLMTAAMDELRPGQSVLQTACVYGNFSQRLARRVGADGRLEVIDVAPIQVRHARRKLQSMPQARVRLADAADLGPQCYDAICCFFLIHEVPMDYKRQIIAGLLERVRPGGKVVFVDYHRPKRLHPLRPVMRLVFALLEPFATEIWNHELSELAPERHDISWSKKVYFGGLYQKVVARRAG